MRKMKTQQLKERRTQMLNENYFSDQIDHKERVAYNLLLISEKIRKENPILARNLLIRAITHDNDKIADTRISEPYVKYGHEKRLLRDDNSMESMSRKKELDSYFSKSWEIHSNQKHQFYDKYEKGEIFIISIVDILESICDFVGASQRYSEKRNSFLTLVKELEENIELNFNRYMTFDDKIDSYRISEMFINFLTSKTDYFSLYYFTECSLIDFDLTENMDYEYSNLWNVSKGDKNV